MNNAIGVTVLAVSAFLPVWVARQVLTLIVNRMNRSLSRPPTSTPN